MTELAERYGISWKSGYALVRRVEVPNDRWTADVKRQCWTQDQIYGYPLTVADQQARFLLSCHGLRSVKGEEARPVFERAFREYWLPRAIRTANGPPFVTRALCGL